MSKGRKHRTRSQNLKRWMTCIENVVVKTCQILKEAVTLRHQVCTVLSLYISSPAVLLRLRATYSYTSHFCMKQVLKICTHNSDIGSNPVGVTGRFVRPSCCVHMSFPSSNVPSTFNYQPLFFCSSLLLKKISRDALSLRSRFPNQPHKNLPAHNPFSPQQHPEPTWTHWTTEETERRVIGAPSGTDSAAGWSCRLSWVHTGHQPPQGSCSPTTAFPKRKSKPVGLQSSLLSNKTNRCWGQKWVPERHMEDATGSQCSFVRPKSTPPQTRAG